MSAPEVEPAIAKIPAQRVPEPAVSEVVAPRPPVPPRPRRSRRRATVVSIVLIVAVAVIPSILFGHHPATHSTARSVARSTASSTASRSATPSAPPVDPGSPEAINAELSKQSAALLRGDEKGWLAPVDPRAKTAIAGYERIFHNMRAMHVAVWTQDDSFGEVTSGHVTLAIDVTYCLVVRGCTDTTAELTVTAELRHGVVLIESLAKPAENARTKQPLPWQVATLSAVVGPRVVVAASSAEAYRLRSVLPMAVAAAAADDRFARWGKPTEYVLYLADDAEFHRWLGGGHAHDIGFEANVGEHDLPAVVRLPMAATNGGPGGVRYTIQHEFGHVATLQGMFSFTDDSFIEGLADYCASDGHPSWVGYKLAAARDYIRSGRWSKKIFMTKQIESSNLTTDNGAYGIGYLGLHYLTNTYGLSTMLAFWGAVEQTGLSLTYASESVLHKSWTSVNAAAVRYVERSLGG